MKLEDFAPAHETWVGDTLDSQAVSGDPNPEVLRALAHWAQGNAKARRFIPALMWLADHKCRPRVEGTEGNLTFSWLPGDGGSPHVLPAEVHSALQGGPYKSGREAYLAAMEALTGNLAAMKASSKPQA